MRRRRGASAWSIGWCRPSDFLRRRKRWPGRYWNKPRLPFAWCSRPWRPGSISRWTRPCCSRRTTSVCSPPRPTCGKAPPRFSRSGSPGSRGADPRPARLSAAVRRCHSPSGSAIFHVRTTRASVRLERLIARGFRNLDDVHRELPPAGVALVGPNGQGKTNLLEALYYPVLFRSLRGAPDPEVARFGGPGFHVEAWVAGPAGGAVATTFTALGRKKRITVRGEEIVRLADAIGSWLAVAFLPADVGLAGGPAAERRAFLDRLLALADRRYYAALARYRAALAQRNTGLRQERPELARAFDGVLAQAGATVVAARLAWVAQVAGPFAAELDALGELEPVCLRYHGRAELGEAAASAAALDAFRARE